MKRTRHTPELSITTLRDADAMLAAGRSVGQVVQALGVSEQTFNRRRHQYGGMEAASKRWRRLNGSELIREVIASVDFTDGIRTERAAA